MTAVEMSLSRIRASLSSHLTENPQGTSHNRSSHSLKSVSNNEDSGPKTIPASFEAATSGLLTAKTKIGLPEGTSPLHFPPDDVIANGIVSEALARISLEG